MEKQEGTSLREILRIVYRRIYILKIIVIVLPIATLVVCFMVNPIYKTGAKILVTAKNENTGLLMATKNTTSNPIFTLNVDESDVNSEMELLLSRDLWTQTVKTLGLDYFRKEEKGFFAPLSEFFDNIKSVLAGGSDKARANSADSPEERELENTVTALVASTKAVPLPKSKVIELEFKYDDPIKAKEILTTHLKLYLPYHQKAYSVPGAQKFFSGQGVAYKKKMEEAYSQLIQFKTKWGLASPETQKSQLIRMISQVRDALVGLNANEIQYRSMVELLNNDVIPTGQLAASLKTSEESTVVNVIAAQLIRAEQKRLEAGEMFAAKSRNLDAAEDMVNTLKMKLKQTLDGELKNLEVTKTSLQTDLKGLEKKLEVLEAKSQEAKTLEIEAKIAKERYLQFASRGEAAKVENLMEGKQLVTARVVSQPYIPASPVFPKKGLMVLGAFLLAFPLGLGLILAANFMDRTFDTPQEVEAITGVKVLASLKRVSRFRI